MKVQSVKLLAMYLTARIPFPSRNVGTFSPNYHVQTPAYNHGGTGSEGGRCVKLSTLLHLVLALVTCIWEVLALAILTRICGFLQSLKSNTRKAPQN